MTLMLLKFIVGLILLLIGVELLRKGLWELGHSKIEKIIQKATINPWRGFALGTIITAFIQSSSAVTVLTVGLVNGGVISFYQSLGLILGANLGTCITVQIMALDLTQISIPLIFIGILISTLKRTKSLGIAFLGFGLIFISLDFMAKALLPFKNSLLLLGPLSNAATNPWQGLTAGIILTGLLQSSSVVIGMTIVLCSQEILTSLGALNIILGANIGTCFTAIVASIFSSKAAKRTALAHLLINAIGALLVLPLLPLINSVLNWVTPDLPKQLAQFHTLFNLLSSLAALPFLKILAWFLTRIVPD
ncbi:MAG: phosphate:Na+ symporter [Clostridia bacterium]|nr:phosphate:Na+ symporter [Clostridia bacterium]